MPRVEQIQQKALDEFRQKNLNSGKRKKQKKSQDVNETIITFICLFFLLSFVFMQVVKTFTPKIDTSVGNNAVVEADEVRDNKMKVDDRLKLIQFNDSMVSGEFQHERENSIFNSALDEPVRLPSHQKQADENLANDDKQEAEKTLDERVSNIISKSINNEPKAEKSAPVPAAKHPSETPSIPAYKVFVGLYQTQEQAQIAKSIIKESTLGQNAFVKPLQDGYTLQIGSYASKHQAEAMVNALKLNNFPLARMITE